MPAMSLYLNDELYELVKKMEHDWILQGRSATVERFIRLGWAHWSGCLDEEKEYASSD